ncbi:MAG: hypothetical protein EOM87_02390 [Clostridia bacterium]|nr:hypothetical protein [Clostridia bacterium]
MALNDDVREYTLQLNKGHIQKAYSGIMKFMSELRIYLENKFIDYTAGALYYGYMDMTYFAFTPSQLKDKKLKVAIVYMHKEGVFELWLAANNRQIQSNYNKFLSLKDTGGYTLSKINPGVDSIIATIIDAKPDFDYPEQLIKLIEEKILEFIKDIVYMLSK